MLPLQTLQYLIRSCDQAVRYLLHLTRAAIELSVLQEDSAAGRRKSSRVAHQGAAGATAIFSLPSPCFHQIGLHGYYQGSEVPLISEHVISAVRACFARSQQEELNAAGRAWLAAS